MFADHGKDQLPQLVALLCLDSILLHIDGSSPSEAACVLHHWIHLRSSGSDLHSVGIDATEGHQALDTSPSVHPMR